MGTLDILVASKDLHQQSNFQLQTSHGQCVSHERKRRAIKCPSVCWALCRGTVSQLTLTPSYEVDLERLCLLNILLAGVLSGTSSWGGGAIWQYLSKHIPFAWVHLSEFTLHTYSYMCTIYRHSYFCNVVHNKKIENNLNVHLQGTWLSSHVI